MERAVDLGIKAIDRRTLPRTAALLYMAGGMMAELTPTASPSPRRAQSRRPWPMPPPFAWNAHAWKTQAHRAQRLLYLNVAEAAQVARHQHAVISARSAMPKAVILAVQPRRPHRIARRPLLSEATAACRYADGRGTSPSTPTKTLSRPRPPVLLLPVEWTADGCGASRNPRRLTARCPCRSRRAQEPFFDPTDNFTTPELGMQWPSGRNSTSPIYNAIARCSKRARKS